MNVLLYYIEPKLDNTIIIILSTQSTHGLHLVSRGQTLSGIAQAPRERVWELSYT